MDFDGLEGQEGIEVVKGDITESESVMDAVKGVGSVLHLAALLPPNSEKDKQKTFAVNVDGTKNIVDAVTQVAPEAIVVFTSSISTYGDTSEEDAPVGVGHSQSAIDIYADSKIHGEKIVRESEVKKLTRNSDWMNKIKPAIVRTTTLIPVVNQPSNLACPRSPFPIACPTTILETVL